MDLPTAKYIIDHYLYTLKLEEMGPIRITISGYLRAASDQTDPATIEDNPNITRLYRKNGWLTEDQDLTHMYKMGQDQFYIFIAGRLKERYGSEIIINKCPKCAELCRTPRAKQCRYCLYDWH